MPFWISTTNSTIGKNENMTYLSMIMMMMMMMVMMMMMMMMHIHQINLSLSLQFFKQLGDRNSTVVNSTGELEELNVSSCYLKFFSSKLKVVI